MHAADFGTERMWLRKLTAVTAAEFVDLLVEPDSDPEVMRHLTGAATPRAVVADQVVPGLLVAAGARPDLGRWLAFDNSSGVFLGWFSLQADVPDDRSPSTPPDDEAAVGYRLRRSAWGRGLATEGTTALLSKAFFELGLRRVWAQTMFVNARSRAVLDRAGMQHFRTLHVASTTRCRAPSTARSSTRRSPGTGRTLKPGPRGVGVAGSIDSAAR